MSITEGSGHKEEGLRFPKLIVFVSSFCLMVIEIIAGRIMAPYLGVSLYTWTSVIGVVLAGISIGNYIGGKAADSFPSKKLLGFSFFFSSTASSMIIFFSNIIGTLLSDSHFPLPLSTFLYSLVVFFIPSMALSLITPIVIKLTLKDLHDTGKTVGQIYAFSTIGSILGTLFTGYFFIAWFGTKFIVTGVALTLFIMTFYVGFDVLKFFGKKYIFFFLTLITSTILIHDNCFSESNYYCIQIAPYQKNSEDYGLTLSLDHLIHSYVSKKDIKNLGYKYEKSFALINQYFNERKNFKLLFLGGGGYVLPRLIEKMYPESVIDVVEIDPGVTRVNYEKLFLEPTTAIVTHNFDARIYMQNINIEDTYDIIYADVFNDISVPYHLTTKEFNEKIKSHLKPEGFYVANIIDEFEKGSFLSSYVNTLQDTFLHIYLAPLDNEWQKNASHRNTFVVISGEKVLDDKRWKLASSELVENKIYNEDEREDVEYLVYGADLKEAFRNKKKIFLSDDYAPVDNMLAIVFKNNYTR